MSILPDDVLHYNVLTRLPVKSLLRFKSVCKYWYNLINSSTFLNIYRRYAIKSHDYYSSDDLLIVNFKSLIDNYSDWGNFFTYLYAPQFSHGVSFKFDKQFELPMVGIVGASYNGVICVHVNYQNAFALYNPITKECHNIIEPRFDRYNFLLDSTYGFGYDSVSDDYKIIHFYEFLVGPHSQLGVVAQIYSTRSNSLKKAEINLSNTRLYTGPCEVNNVLHYICSMTSFSNTYLSIFTIDLHTVKLNCMALPVKLIVEDDDESFSTLLFASNGRLYFSLSNFEPLHDTIWVMKEYGVTESWTKLYELEGGNIVKSRIVSYKLSNKGGEVLLIKPVDKQSDELVWYNLEDKSFKKVDVPGKWKFSHIRCLCMNGSLAPILGSTAITQAEE